PSSTHFVRGPRRADGQDQGAPRTDPAPHLDRRGGDREVTAGPSGRRAGPHPVQRRLLLRGPLFVDRSRPGSLGRGRGPWRAGGGGALSPGGREGSPSGQGTPPGRRQLRTGGGGRPDDRGTPHFGPEAEGDGHLPHRAVPPRRAGVPRAASPA